MKPNFNSTRSAIGQPRYYVYSPVTKHFKVLSRPQVNEHGYLWICSASLAFDPLQSPHYKVVCIWRNDMVNHHIEIYSSSTDSWWVSGCPVPAPKIMFYTSGVFWNGSLHWISLRNFSFYFDIDQDLIKVMPMPPTNPGIDKIRVEYFGVCQGHLNLIQTSGSSITRFDILEMESDYSGWNVKYHVNLEALTALYFERPELLNHSRFSVLLVHEEEESSSLVLQIQDKIISYDIRSCRFIKLHDLSQIHGNVSKLYRYYDAYQYIPTLSSV
ncbi:F-box protein At5g07610-like isoform X1 [Papaver somniferum]|uniref:F-box protein At5g07610-like isoform X1 n=1 Tax=Papaver somniferum TaxID=3469 RepID=UPI000E6FB1B7|nr:F-box protein At5g07610-like isoform X1 [Papaver somniferum]XP_026404816.1 F-box protein At5g07610-like isoform X1 [Papaver somniferum]XP_026404818.1 F-box protein At5g07610-like isoform X1 [Papaver somniferum]